MSPPSFHKELHSQKEKAKRAAPGNYFATIRPPTAAVESSAGTAERHTLSQGVVQAVEEIRTRPLTRKHETVDRKNRKEWKKIRRTLHDGGVADRGG